MRLKYRQFPAIRPESARTGQGTIARLYDFNPAVAAPEEENVMNECKHPRVRIVAREPDAEFVECLECNEVFESSEFKDMNIEETKLKDHRTGNST